VQVLHLVNFETYVVLESCCSYTEMLGKVLQCYRLPINANFSKWINYSLISSRK